VFLFPVPGTLLFAVNVFGMKLAISYRISRGANRSEADTQKLDNQLSERL